MRRKIVLLLFLSVLLTTLFGSAVYYINRRPVGYEKTPVTQLFEKDIVNIKVTSDYDISTVEADKELCNKLITEEKMFDIFKTIKYSARQKPADSSLYLGWTEIQVFFSDDTVLFIEPYGEYININRKFYYPDTQLHGFAETLYSKIKKDGKRVQ